MGTGDLLAQGQRGEMSRGCTGGGTCNGLAFLKNGGGRGEMGLVAGGGMF